jgi:hypothetical protein
MGGASKVSADQALGSDTDTSASNAGTPGMLSSGHYPPEVIEAAKPHLTGDVVADEDILGFYMARHSMIHGGG